MTRKPAKSSKEANEKSNNPKKTNLTIKDLNEKIKSEIEHGSTMKKRTMKLIKDLKEKIKGEEEKYLRLFAEFENYKKRTTKERIDLYKTAGKEVIMSLMPVLEDFKRALNQETGKFDHTEGISLIYNKLSETLKSQGLIEIKTDVGDDFDSEKHEAISQIPAEKKGNKGKIIDVIEGGYSLGDQIIKFPKVVVAQ